MPGHDPALRGVPAECPKGSGCDLSLGRGEFRRGLMTHLQQQGVACKKYPGFDGAFVEITAPEGTTLYAFEQDFLGESYEVEESGLFSELSL